MQEEDKKILQLLATIREKLQEQSISLKDVPSDQIQMFMNAAFRVDLQYTECKKDLIANIAKLYALAEQYGNGRQQAAALGMIEQLLSVWLEHEDVYNNEKQGMKDEIHKHQETLKLVKLYHKNKLTDDVIEKYVWGDVARLKEKTNVKLFCEISNEIRKKNIERIRKKKKIKVAFLVKDSAEWSVDALYRKLAEDERYEVAVMVAPFWLGTEITVKDTYDQAVQYFQEKGYHTIPMCEMGNGCLYHYNWHLLQEPDVIFMLNPHYTAFAEASNVLNFPLQSLVIYIPYGFLIYGNIHDQYNQLSHALSWKIFWGSDVDIEMSRKYADCGDSNAQMSGYLKMDGFYNGEESVVRNIWKIPQGLDEKKVKKIVYAPHWSIREAVTGFGNFDKTYHEFYEYAKSHADTTSWIFRPHPMLRAGLVQYGVFETEKDFDDYMKKWDELPNARVVERGEYIHIFKTADALIGDSISFLAEFQYTHKPLLFLTRKENTFNDFGKMLIKILYTAPGDDFEAIADFIQNVVIEENDSMYHQRQEFFDKYLDYWKRNGQLAGEYIKKLLDETLS
ncbi:MAG: CDP-glycerol glycerophosphotransferase family protein [Roseburia intestinalis]